MSRSLFSGTKKHSRDPPRGLSRSERTVFDKLLYDQEAADYSDQEFRELVLNLSDAERYYNHSFKRLGFFTLKLYCKPVKAPWSEHLVLTEVPPKKTGTSAPYEIAHTFFVVNEKLILDWDTLSLATLRGLPFKLPRTVLYPCYVIDDIDRHLPRLAELLVRCNTEKTYSMLKYNCQHFVNEVMSLMELL